MHAFVLRPPRQQVEGDTVEAFTRVLEDEVNLASWRRSLSPGVAGFAQSLLVQADTGLAESMVLDVQEGSSPKAAGLLAAYRAFPGYADFIDDVSYLMDAFVCLFDVSRVGLRVRVLDHAMCPRWHVDHVPVRLITTYAGAGSEWLGEGTMPRQALGSPASDQYAGLPPAGQLGAGDVALFKGERWQGNELGGIIHRSPRLQPGTARLVMTLDWLG